MDAEKWRWIVGANQMRAALTPLAQEQPEGQWVNTGRDVQRGWAASQVCVFTHRPGGWSRPVTIVARRWREVDDLPLPELWDYAFAGTNLEPSDLPKHILKKYGFGPYVWMLYGMKQGHETHFKTALSDLGMHHPPSGRFGVDQAYATLMTAAANITMVFRYRVLSPEDRGMRLWRIRERDIEIPGKITVSGHVLQVELAGGEITLDRKRLWLEAFATAGRL